MKPSPFILLIIVSSLILSLFLGWVALISLGSLPILFITDKSHFKYNQEYKIEKNEWLLFIFLMPFLLLGIILFLVSWFSIPIAFIASLFGLSDSAFGHLVISLVLYILLLIIIKRIKKAYFQSKL